MTGPRRDPQPTALTAEEHRALAETGTAAALDALVEGIAHHVRTPLTALQTNAFLLQRRIRLAAEGRQAVGDEELRLVDRLVRSVDRLTAVVANLRHLSGIEPAEFDILPLHEVAAETVDLFHATADDGVVIHAALDPTPPVVLDRPLVQLAILNLLQNAHEAAAEGGRTIRVRSGTRDGRAILEVTDTGLGMPEEVCGRVFEPLFTTKPGSSGLGLTMVKRILDQHAAAIAFETRLGEGTSFVLTFAAAEGAEAAASATRAHP